MDLWGITELGYFTRVTAVPNYYRLFEGVYSPSIRPSQTEPWGSLTGSITSQQDLMDYVATQINGKANTSDLTVVVNNVNANAGAITACLVKTANLSDLDNLVQARTNLDVYSKEEVQSAITSAENVVPTSTGPSGQIFQGGPGPHQYWRVLTTAINGDNQPVVLAELQFREVVGVSQLPTVGSSVFSSTSGGNGPGAPFDGNPNTVWSSAAQPSSAVPQWIGWNYGAGVTKAINQIAVTNTPNGSFGHVAPYPAEESPTNLTVQYSDDGVNWFNEWTIIGIAWTGSPSQTLIFTHPRAGQSVTATQNYPTTLVALNDVTVSEGGLADGVVLTWSNADHKWEAKASAFTNPIAAGTILGNNTAGAASPAALTALQVAAMLPVFTNTAKGMVPASGGGAIAFLRADGGFYVPTLGGLSDIDFSTAPGDGQALLYNGTTGKWKAAALPSGVVTLAALNDVALGTLADGKLLTYQASSGKWIAQAPQTVISSFAGLSDVNVTGVTAGMMLYWNSATSKWNAKNYNIPVLIPSATGPLGETITGGPPAKVYWRVRGSSSNGSNLAASNVQFRTALGVTVQNTGGSPLAGSSYSGMPLTNAFDTDINTSWAANGNNDYIGYQFAAATTIVEVAISARNDTFFAQCFGALYVEYSVDGINWVTQFSRTGITWTSAGQQQIFTDPNAGVAAIYNETYPTALAALNDVSLGALGAGQNGYALTYNNATGKWNPTAVSVSQFTSSAAGVVPASGGGTVNFLRADGAWAAPAGGGGGGTSTALSIPQLTAHRYWIVQWDFSRDFAFSISELQFRATPGGANQTGTGTAIASASDAGAAANAFDGNTSTQWGTTANDASGFYLNPSWLGYDFGAGNAKVVQEIQISPRYDSAADQTPLHGRVMYSDDGVNYYPAWEFNFATAWALGTPRTSTSPWVSAAGLVGMVPIATITVAGTTTTSIDFASIPSNYKHLMLVGQGRSLTAATTDDVLIAFNADATSANYVSQQMQGTGTSVSAGTNPGSMPRHFGSVAGATATAGQAGDFDYKIMNYATTTFIKSWQGRNGLPGYPLLKDVIGKWNVTTAINEIALTLNSGAAWLAGSTFTLYGMN